MSDGGVTSALEAFQFFFPWEQHHAFLMSEGSPPSGPPCLEGLVRAFALPLRRSGGLGMEECEASACCTPNLS